MDSQRLLFILVTSTIAVCTALVAGYASAHLPVKTSLIVVLFAALTALIYKGVDARGLSKFQFAYYLSFLLTFVLVWTPLKTAAYLSPMVTLGLYIIIMSTDQDPLVLRRLIGCVLLWVFLVAVYGFIYYDFVYQNAVIAFFTFSSFIPVLILPSKQLASRKLMKKLVPPILLLATVEAVIGIAQGVYGWRYQGAIVASPGDFVDGTIHIHPMAGSALHHVMFAFNMLMSFIFLLSVRATRGGVFMPFLVLLFAASIMGQVMHLLICFIIAVITALFLFRPIALRGQRSHAKVNLVILAALFAVGIAVFAPARLQSIGNRLKGISDGRNPKVELIKRIILDVPKSEPQMFVVGMGPGQFSSRACAIAAGYLGAIPPPFSYHVTRPFKLYSLDMWYRWSRNPFKGAADSPASSWTGVISEFGLAGFTAFAGFTVWVLLRVRRAARSRRARIEAFFFGTGVLTLFGVGFFEFYWEIPQTIFVGCLMLKLMYANIVYLPDDDDDPVTTGDEGKLPA